MMVYGYEIKRLTPDMNGFGRTIYTDVTTLKKDVSKVFPGGSWNGMIYSCGSGQIIVLEFDLIAKGDNDIEIILKNEAERLMKAWECGVFTTREFHSELSKLYANRINATDADIWAWQVVNQLTQSRANAFKWTL